MSAYIGHFRSAYLECLEALNSVNNREDLLDEIKRVRSNTNTIDLLIHFSTESKPHINRIKNKDYNVINEEEIEPFENISFSSIWEGLDQNSKKTTFDFLKLLVLLSNLYLENEFLEKSNSEKFNTPDIPKLSTETNSKKKKDKRKKKKKKTSTELVVTNLDDEPKVRDFPEGGGGLSSIDDVKEIFKGIKGEGVMSELIDDVMLEIQKPDAFKNNKVKMNPEEEAQMKMIGSMFGIPDDQLGAIIGLSKKITNQFSKKMTNESMDQAELAKCAENLMMNISGGKK